MAKLVDPPKQEFQVFTRKKRIRFDPQRLKAAISAWDNDLRDLLGAFGGRTAGWLSALSFQEVQESPRGQFAEQWFHHVPAGLRWGTAQLKN